MIGMARPLRDEQDACTGLQTNAYIYIQRVEGANAQVVLLDPHKPTKGTPGEQQ